MKFNTGEQIPTSVEINELAKANEIRKIYQSNEPIDHETDIKLKGYFGMPDHAENITESAALTDSWETLYLNQSFTSFCLEFDTIKNFSQDLKLTKDDTFYDLGSGYGQVSNFLALNNPETAFKGVEFVAERAKKAAEVAEELGIKNSVFIQGDINNIDIADGTVFYMYNPFSRETLKAVAEKLKEAAKHKKIKIVSAGDSTGFLANECRDWLALGEQYSWRDRAVIFESK